MWIRYCAHGDGGCSNCEVAQSYTREQCACSLAGGCPQSKENAAATFMNYDAVVLLWRDLLTFIRRLWLMRPRISGTRYAAALLVARTWVLVASAAQLATSAPPLGSR